ncbi:hypothetical protein J3R82DRAFT_2004 [Butyriboletus roseoflavus]|nr:hypothetical protein J3R82DRAFT_2004 [Butyriboletus roseoflavus]
MMSLSLTAPPNRPSPNNSPSSISPAPSRTPSTPKTQTAAPRTSRPSSAKNVNANAPTASVDDSSGTWPWTSMVPASSCQPPAADTSIEAPPSLLPPRHYCDITGLEVRLARLVREHATLMQRVQAPYTDPRTGLRYHDKSVYDLIKNLSPSAAKDYLSARGVNPIVK